MIMEQKIKSFLFGNLHTRPLTTNIGFFILRFFVGLAFCTVFEKFLPREGVWGPQEWFIQDTRAMGFPFPEFFAWFAVLAEFFGGIMLMLGLLTRPMALLNACVTFTATFIYHNGDIGNTGLTSFFFLIMCVCIALFGGGKFSLDYLIFSRRL
jgi:putative oxidoreductase